MAAQSWDGYLDEYLTGCNPPLAYAAALANKDSYELYAASPSAGEKGWGLVHCDPQNRDIMQDDGSEKPTMITESATLKDCVERDMKKDGPSPTGLWLGGQKYKVTTRDENFESGDHKFLTIHAAAPNKKGVHVVCTATNVIVAFYDEIGNDDVKPITSANCKIGAVAFAEYMAGQGL